MNTADAILHTLQSPNVSDSNSEPANVVDALDRLASCAGAIARAILPPDTMPGHDAAGGTVASLTEAIMGMTAGLVQIATAIHDLADAVREGPPQ